MEIITINANTLFSDSLWNMKISGKPVETRNGKALRIMEPVLTRVKNPMQRVLFHQGRDANPIFHLAEAIWMLAGREDVEFVERFNSKIGQYSDDGYVFNAAYGNRMRRHFGMDQLLDVIDVLETDPNSRQAIVQLWDPNDLTKSTKDKACNMQLIFEIVDNKLNMTVINRSNDLWYGYAGANIVHFTVIQEFVASALRVPMGEYRTFTNNLHLYTELYDANRYITVPPDARDYDLYRSGVAKPSPLMEGSDYMSFLDDCQRFCDNPFGPFVKFKHSFFYHTLQPMVLVSHMRKEKIGDGLDRARSIHAIDWRMATIDWVTRREAAKTKGEDKQCKLF